MKTNGKTWQDYLISWPLGAWFDDSDETINGVGGDYLIEEVPADAVVEFTCGVVYQSRDDHEGVSLVSHFRKWLKSLTMTTLVVTFPKDRLEEFTPMLKRLGGSVVK